MDEKRLAWGVVEKHLEEAEFAMARFESSLSSRTMNIARVSSGPERSLLGNVDGLVVGGEPVVERLLLPSLQASPPATPHRAMAIVLALLAARRAELAVRALANEAHEVRRAATRGCVLGAGSSLDAWITQGLVTATPSAVPRATLLELAAERGLVVTSLGTSLRAESATELIAALRAAWRSDPALHEARIIELLEHGSPDVRDAAMVTLLHHGSAYGASACAALAKGPVPHPLAMALHAGLGGPAEHADLAALLVSDAHRPGVVRALGLSGNTAFVPSLIELAQSNDAAIAVLGLESLATITGVEHDESVSVATSPPGLAAWWRGAQGGFDARRRYLGGVPATPAAFANFLTHAPMRRRFLAALLLSIRTGASARVSTRAFSAVQRAQIALIAPRGQDGVWPRALGFS